AAGTRAAGRSDSHAAVSLLERAIALLPVDSLERLELMRPYALALNSTGRVVEFTTLMKEAHEQAVARGEGVLALRLRHPRSGLPSRTRGADVEERGGRAEEAIGAFREIGDDAGIAANLRLLGINCRVEGRLAEAAEWLERAVVHATAGDDQITLRSVTQSLA